ncbi:NAD(P)-dependent oxidoreductase [Rhodopseudomonas boonkerdii]|uniref:NAD-dependent epimerase/dehydratase family protein n=1 Tax=Rhodopseudomonas boonkerdii TaxID=475937 RepID=UPI001E39CCEA|nr:NAD(P)-dependent oxidoreductase [Rhodopseudomonas boonkerdii]UGV28258.1 NAD(P)-dependent oxidoreductase [Rhodopseudomonas boonkerdii]
MHVLIFGGTGFVGLNIAESLLAGGHQVTLFDRAPPPAAALRAFAAHRERLRVVQGDVTDHAAVTAVIGTQVDAAVLGAAITAGPARDAADPGSILQVNLAAQVPILEAARNAGVRRIINLSSAAAYGASGQRFAVLDEDTPCDPVALYPITKFASERVVARLADLWQMDIISVRLSGVFGPWERAGGMRDTPSPQALIMACCAERRPALLSDPGEKDWIYAPDVAVAVQLLLEAERPRHRLYNISTGINYTAEEWGEAFAASNPGFTCRLAAAGETPTVTVYGPTRAPLSIQRLEHEFGWRARFDCATSADDLSRWLGEYGGVE